jgi:hypothetical protein
MQPDQNTEKMNEKKGMQCDLVASEKAIKTFDNESEQSIKTDRSLTIGKSLSSLSNLTLLSDWSITIFTCGFTLLLDSLL